jgi:RND superfamily putative drug exporter
MSGLARWCVRYRWIVVALWVAAGVYTGVIAHRIGPSYSDSFTLPGTDTQRAFDLLHKNFPQVAGDLDTVVMHGLHGRKVTDPRLRRVETAMLAEVAKVPHVVAVLSPFASQAGRQISADGSLAFAEVQFDQLANTLPKSALRNLVTTAEKARGPDLQVELGGQGVQFLEQPSTRASEIAGVLASAIVLFLAFGSWRGMVTPLVAAIAAIFVGTSIESLLSRAMSVAHFTPQLSILIGLGVGVDYALFIVSRHRNHLLAGMSPEDSIAAALNTSGRAVLFAGATVCVALLGLFLLNVTFLVGVAVGAAITVGLTMLASLTLTPALLGFMGRKVLGRGGRRRLEAHGEEEAPATGWLAWARLVERHRIVLSALALGLVGLLAAPFFSMQLGFSDQGNDPKGQTTRTAYDLLAGEFGPGFNGPLQVAVQLKAPGRPQDLSALRDAVARDPDVATVAPPVMALNRTTAVFAVIPRSAPQAEATTQMVKRLRSTLIPHAIPGTAVKVAYVGGATGAYIDFAHVLASKLPLFIAVVVVVASLLLLVAFRSLVIPLTASVMNVFAAGTTYGLLVFVFQQGHLGSVFSIGRPGPIEAFVPVMLFAILFGLSMDYQVFLVSRMHEEWIHTGDNRRSVTVGQAQTGRIITAAASIMIVVFMSFVFSGVRDVAEFGLGLAAAVLIDAFILRTVLVPALMHTLGNANWYLPRWLDRIVPHLSIEPPDRTYDDDLTIADF